MSENSLATVWQNSMKSSQQASTVTAPLLSPKQAYDNLSAMGADAIKSIAAALNSAGYKTPSTGKVTAKFFEQYWRAYGDAMQFYGGTQQIEAGNGINSSQFNQFLTDAANDRASGSGGSNTQVGIINTTTAKALINAVFRNELGRTASNDEVKKYTAMIRAAERSNPVTSSGGVTSGGLNEEQFLIDQISESDDATQNRALYAFDALAKMLGA